MSFGAFPIFLIFDKLVSQKRQVVEQNGPKFGPRVVLSVHEVHLTVKISKYVRGHSVHFEISDFQQPCILKTPGRMTKRTQMWASGVVTWSI